MYARAPTFSVPPRMLTGLRMVMEVIPEILRFRSAHGSRGNSVSMIDELSHT
jgi:hypothetical protein